MFSHTFWAATSVHQRGRHSPNMHRAVVCVWNCFSFYVWWCIRSHHRNTFVTDMRTSSSVDLLLSRPGASCWWRFLLPSYRGASGSAGFLSCRAKEAEWVNSAQEVLEAEREDMTHIVTFCWDYDVQPVCVHLQKVSKRRRGNTVLPKQVIWGWCEGTEGGVRKGSQHQPWYGRWNILNIWTLNVAVRRKVRYILVYIPSNLNVSHIYEVYLICPSWRESTENVWKHGWRLDKPSVCPNQIPSSPVEPVGNGSELPIGAERQHVTLHDKKQKKVCWVRKMKWTQ